MAVLRFPRCPAKSEINVSRPRYQNDAIAACLSAQPGRHAKTTADRREAHPLLLPFADSGLMPPPSRSAPQCQVIQSRSRCDPCRHGQADKWKARAIAIRCEELLLLVVWQPNRRTMTSTIVSLWNLRRKLILLNSSVIGSQISWAVVKRWPAKEGRGSGF